MVLILTAGYGEGHNAAARGLHKAFEELGVASDVVDVFGLVGGDFYQWSRRAYLELINRAPLIWAGVFKLIDRMPLVPMTMPLMGGMQRALGRLLDEKKPDAVVSVYPAYGYFLDRLYPDTRHRPFSFHTIVTDSITVNSVWYRCGSDTFIVPNPDTARVMRAAGVAGDRLRDLGFPVPPRFAQERAERLPPGEGRPLKVLFMVNAGKALAPAIVSHLLDLEGVQLTVTVGRDLELQARVQQAAAGRPVEIYGWTDKMPELLMSHHLLIGKAGGAAVQETIAAGTPMLMTHVVPGQEEGNARLLVENHCGAVCPTPEQIQSAVGRLMADNGRLWKQWNENVARLSRPAASFEIARFVLGEER
jgi:processive 1,2-diacylglycerol beta-glucosyltransferase